jgi:hypothetical protein
MKKIIVLIILFCTTSVIYSQNDSKNSEESISEWEVDVTPYLWFAGANADISFLNQTLPVEATFTDVLSNLKMGIFLHAEVKKGDWFIMGDLFYIKIAKDGSIDKLSLDTRLELKQTIAELALGYNLINAKDWLFIDGFVGFRYFSIVNTIDVGSQNLLDKTINATDPIVGVRFRTISDKWINSARIDVGGFGIGSEISWKANLIVGYKFSDLFSLYVGLQGYGINYEKNNFGLNSTTAGLATGFNFHF